MHVHVFVQSVLMSCLCSTQGNDTSRRADFNKTAQVRQYSSNYMLTLSDAFSSISALLHCCALQAVSSSSAALPNPGEAYSGRSINPTLFLLRAWQRRQWKDTVKNTLTMVGFSQEKKLHNQLWGSPPNSFYKRNETEERLNS